MGSRWESVACTVSKKSVFNYQFPIFDVMVDKYEREKVLIVGGGFAEESEDCNELVEKYVGFSV